MRQLGSGVSIRTNAHPYRLDIDWRLCKYAKDKGVKIAINPDAHDEEGLKDTYYGVGIGRKGWLESGDVLNTMDLDEMKNFLKEKNFALVPCPSSALHGLKIIIV